ncbi:kinase-like protein [Atractiella rhizophila]|nr:kinase-like protein [Atractiella rhizophila]
MDRFDIIPYTDLSPESSWTRLGKGSFGCVYKGKYLGMTVAIKEVLQSTEYDVQKYFQRECKIMQEARHPNVVQYIGLSLAPPPPSHTLPPFTFQQTTVSSPSSPKPPPKRILIISEYLPRGNLRQYILSSPPPPTTLPFYQNHNNGGANGSHANGNHGGGGGGNGNGKKYLKEDEEEDQDDADYRPMPWRLRVSFAVDVTRAVAYLHARGCMHRDLKGENLLVTENERLKVCDFGFARLVAKSEQERRRITFCGTDGYMSPEILLGEEFGLETDIYSLGIIFCELLSRKLVDNHTFARSPPLYTLDANEVHSLASPGCPPSFIRLALECCATDPRQRPGIRQVLDGLRAVEEEVVKMERERFEVEAEANVGTAKFGGSTRAKGKERPKGVRMPSFEGKVKPYEKREVVTPSKVKEEEGEGEDGSRYSTSVVRAKNGSVLLGGSRITVPGGEEEEEDGSNLTIKARKDATRPGLGNLEKAQESGSRFSNLSTRTEGTGSSLPSIPSAWKKIPSESSSADADQVDGEGEEVELLGDGLRAGEQGRSTMPPQSQMGTIRTDMDGTTFHSAQPSIAAATINGSIYLDARSTIPTTVFPSGAANNETPLEQVASHTNGSVYVDAPSVPSETETETETEDEDPSPLPGQEPHVARSPSTSFGHRFTIVRPTWRAVYNGHGHHLSASASSSGGEGGGKRSSLDGKRSSLGALGGVLGSVLSKCAYCGKRLGVMKEYLECDDCSFRCHVKCGELVPRTCSAWESDGSTPNGAREAEVLQPPSPSFVGGWRKEGSKLKKGKKK